MKSLKKYLAVFILIAIGTIAILNSCKKVDNSNGLSKPELEGIEKVKKNVQAQMDALGGIPQRVEVNQRMQMAYADMNGNIIKSLPSSPTLVSTCAGDFPNNLDLNYYYRLYTCGVGYKIKFGWMISWNNNVVLQNPFNLANKTKGTVRVSVPGNANAYNNTTFDVQIQDLGDDPDNLGSNIFFVEMTSSTLIPVSVVNTPGAILRLSAFFASDCSTLDNYSVVPMSVTGFGFTTPLNSDPCTRNDKGWFQLPDQVGYRQIGITGYDPLSTCPSYTAGAAPSYQRVQYSLDNGVTWTGFQNYSAASTGRPALNNQEYVSRTDFARSPTLAVGTYNIKIRYANTKFSSSGTSLNTVPSNSNSCINGGWGTEAWTVESYPGVVVN